MIKEPAQPVDLLFKTGPPMCLPLPFASACIIKSNLVIDFSSFMVSDLLFCCWIKFFFFYLFMAFSYLLLIKYKWKLITFYHGKKTKVFSSYYLSHHEKLFFEFLFHLFSFLIVNASIMFSNTKFPKIYWTALYL